MNCEAFTPLNSTWFGVSRPGVNFFVHNAQKTLLDKNAEMLIMRVPEATEEWLSLNVSHSLVDSS